MTALEHGGPRLKCAFCHKKHRSGVECRVRNREERVAGPPHFVSQQQLKFAGDVLGRNADAMQNAGAKFEDHYAQNQLAHWLWHLAKLKGAPGKAR